MNPEAVESWGMSNEEIAAYPTVYRDDLLAGKVVLIAGGDAGLGRATAYLCARLGGEVMICGPLQTELDATVQGVKQHLGRDIQAQAMRIHQPEAVDALLARVWQQFGKLDILVNSGGGGQTPGDAIDFSVEQWTDVVESKLNGCWYMMQKAAQRWREDEQAGSIVNLVADIWRGMPGLAHSCAADAGLVFAGNSLAVEWAPYNIRVNCVSHGTIARSDISPTGPDNSAELTRANPMLSCGDVMDIAEAVVYLAAPSGKFITGECLTVDGGQKLWGEVWPNGKPDYFATP
ncbi:MAG: SDR family oxidoreductase [Gammaproteobacteria bacterium]|nr:SDR family oxidoreductase [Gammaproteobacteria bacterium]MBQ0838538.1 SDR family oxidoreductase [Gammaproteobacteria bacterium]